MKSSIGYGQEGRGSDTVKVILLILLSLRAACYAGQTAWETIQVYEQEMMSEPVRYSTTSDSLHFSYLLQQTMRSSTPVSGEEALLAFVEDTWAGKSMEMTVCYDYIPEGSSEVASTTTVKFAYDGEVYTVSYDVNDFTRVEEYPYLLEYYGKEHEREFYLTKMEFMSYEHLMFADAANLPVPFLVGYTDTVENVSEENKAPRRKKGVQVLDGVDLLEEKTEYGYEIPMPTPIELPVEYGEIITFGSYEQDNNLENGAEQIEWIVLDEKENQRLLISKNCLDVHIFSSQYYENLWETSDLREWLNETFYQKAFSDEEQERIVTTQVKNPQRYRNGEYLTEDKVFVLSTAEAEIYFADDKARQAQPTAYAVWQSSRYNQRSTAIEDGFAWWLRAYYGERSTNAYVWYDGSVIEIDNSCLTISMFDIPQELEHIVPLTYDEEEGYRLPALLGVRPAIWITVE